MLGGVVGALRGEGYDLGEPGVRLDLRSGGKARRDGEALAAIAARTGRESPPRVPGMPGA